MKKIIPFLFFLIACSSFVFAVAPITQIVIGEEEGLILEYPKFDSIKQGQHYYMFMSVFNKTDGIMMANDTTSCTLHINNISGEHMIEEDFSFNDVDFSLYIGSGNFSQLGTFYYMVQCNTSSYGGAVSGLFEVVKQLEELTIDKAIMYSSFLFGLLILFMISTIGTFVIDGKNTYDLWGNLIKINFNKHLKSFLFFLSYFIFILIVFMATKISYYYLIDSIVYSIIYWIQITLWICLIPAFLLYIGLTIVSILNDSKLGELTERNLKPYGGKDRHG